MPWAMAAANEGDLRSVEMERRARRVKRESNDRTAELMRAKLLVMTESFGQCLECKGMVMDGELTLLRRQLQGRCLFFLLLLPIIRIHIHLVVCHVG